MTIPLKAIAAEENLTCLGFGTQIARALGFSNLA